MKAVSISAVPVDSSYLSQLFVRSQLSVFRWHLCHRPLVLKPGDQTQVSCWSTCDLSISLGWFFFNLSFLVTSCAAQGLCLAPLSRIIPGRAQETIWVIGDWIWASQCKARTLLTIFLASFLTSVLKFYYGLFVLSNAFCVSE